MNRFHIFLLLEIKVVSATNEHWDVIPDYIGDGQGDQEEIMKAICDGIGEGYDGVDCDGVVTGTPQVRCRTVHFVLVFADAVDAAVLLIVLSVVVAVLPLMSFFLSVLGLFVVVLGASFVVAVVVFPGLLLLS